MPSYLDLDGVRYFAQKIIDSVKSIYAEPLRTVYPVGSVYITTHEKNPAEIFGFGTWEQIKDRFLLAAGDTYSGGAVGGEESHTLTSEEIPNHAHDFSLQVPVLDSQGSKQFSNSNWFGYESVSTITSTGAAGGGQAHNNMPPYLAVYVWKRTE